MMMVVPLASQAAGPCTEYLYLHGDDISRVHMSFAYPEYMCDDDLDTGERSTSNNENNNNNNPLL